ncbi:hypothetical protein Q31b_07550 [Novipirellula aureliae]|uniref:Prenyltransferase and squalene oxidase repeat protein n=1 Tax=Novipirellula aureliae TaxID=2527966 RepID=A0A5C6EA39_9BACT|nr:hypothetical protein [Novipirellula aureliae]TWU45580.1 hypothetical protein Q31b_07550 [Novipirellula aureliae]
MVVNDRDKYTRRRAMQTAGALLASSWSGSHSDPVIAEEFSARLYLADATDRAVQQAIDFLIDKQDSEGAIADRNHPVTMTSLAIMAMASIGTQPSDNSKFAHSMRRAIDYVLKPVHQTKEGYFGQYDSSRMYGHGITTLMLTEMLGMGVSRDQNRRIFEALAPAIALILAAQKVPKSRRHRGGWRYEPTSRDSDLSVSVWQVMALRSAKNDSLNVPKQAIDFAIEFLQESFAQPELLTTATSATPAGEDGALVRCGFTYMPGSRQSTFAMTSAGLLAIQVCGLYESPMVTSAAEWLLKYPPEKNDRFFFYGIYYYAQAMHQAGGKYAKTAEEVTSKMLLDSQKTNGSWVAENSEERNVGAVYATSLAVLSLSVRYHYLPIYQR